MPYSVISGTGSYLPKKKLTNNDLASQLDTTDAWIVERTGIQSRSIAESQESTAFLATNAARLAIESAGVDKNDIDMIIVATCSPDNFFPSVGSEVQYRLGLSRSIPAFDISVACSGFIYALDIADKYVTQGIARHILVIGAEQMSKTVNWEDRSTCILFGDGAGAVMLSHSTTKKGIISSVLHAKYDDARLLQLRNTHVQPATYPFVEMKGNELFRVAVTLMGYVAG
jgi:3-oxoacyl-[acyl-carrier-protein] synthase-3